MHATLDRFTHTLKSGCLSKHSYLMGTEGDATTYYVPFEQVSVRASLSLVGITPGPTQMETAYKVAGRALVQGLSPDAVLRRAKQAGAFDGMRPHINEMLDHFRIPQRLGLGGAESLWGSNYDLFHPTSIVPNAAFRSDAYFNGPFAKVLSIGIFRKEFEDGFVASLKKLDCQPFFVAMGPVVAEAIRWCIDKGHIGESQYLGYLPHASGASGSQFAYFMRRKTREELERRNDPVRFRVDKLDDAYSTISMNVNERLPKE